MKLNQDEIVTIISAILFYADGFKQTDSSYKNCKTAISKLTDMLDELKKEEKQNKLL